MKKSLSKITWLACVFMLFGTAWVQAQTDVSGTVTDAAGMTMPGVNVSIQGTLTGTVTDVDGKYSIKVPNENAILVFSFVGYAAQEVAVGNRRLLDVILEEAATAIDEVVVIGYGTVRKNDATGAVVAVKVEDQNRGLVTTPQNLLAGKIAGVSVVTSGGQPGGDATIRIRGGSSLTANNDPLIVIDGVIMNNKGVAGLSNPLSTVNPNDIESFSVLKDASATAIYGSRASNGVILITTKKGTAGRTKFTYSGNISINTPRKKMDVLSASEYRDLITNSPAATSDMLAALNLYPNVNTDWQDVIYKTALGTDHNLSALGSIGKYVPFRASVGYTNEDGVLRTSNFERFSGDISLTPSLLDDHLKITLNAKGAYIKNQFADAGAIVGTAANFDPTKPVKNDNTKYGGFYTWTSGGDPNGTKLGSSPTNPASRLGMTDDHSDVKSFVGNLQLDYKLHFFPDLRLFMNLSMDYATSDGQKYTRPDAPSNYGEDPLRTGRNETYNETRKNGLFEFYGQYTKDVQSIKSRFDVMAGYSYQSYTNDKDDVAYFLSRNEDSWGENTVIDGQANSIGSKAVLISFFGRFNYSFMDRYLLTFTLRDDATSRFSKDNRWGLFPSLALGWRITEENFMKDFKAMNNLKLRLGWGITGQQDLSKGDYPYLSFVRMGKGAAMFPLWDAASGTYKWVNVSAITAGNNDLKWEETATWNVGFDYGFYKNRINGAIDLYYKKTTDLLNDKVNQPAGKDFAEYVLSNVGSLENKGIEFSINATAIDTKDFAWELGFNIAYNKTKITELTYNDENSLSPGNRFESTGGDGGKDIKIHSVGYAPGSFFVYEQIYDQNGKPIEGAYVDRNNDGVINNEDLYQYKKPDADVLIGFSSKFLWRNWDLGFNGRASIGNFNYNANASGAAALNVTGLFGNNCLSNRPRSALETNFQERQRQSDYYVQNASFLKIDNITLGYTLPRIGAWDANARFYATVQNPVVITKYSGLDPETNAGASPGMDNNLYPRPLTFIFGLSFNF